MVREVVRSQCGIQFEEEALDRLSIPTMDKSGKSTGDNHRALDKADASAPMHNKFKMKPLWLLLEIIFFSQRPFL